VALRRPKLLRDDPPRRAVTAATAMVELGASSSWKTWKFGNTDWQTEAWRLYDIVGELRKLGGRVGDSLAQARMYVAELDERGEETGETGNPRISALAGIPLGTGSQRDDALRLAGVDLAVGGECWIVGEGAARNPESAEGAWFVVTSAAFRKSGDQVKVKRPKVQGGRDLTLTDGVDVLIRCWRPHPNDTDQADSFARSAIVPLREIELLTKREFAELDSRLTGAGLMFLPEGIDFPREESDPEGIAGFMAYTQRVAATSMRDQSSASAMVPIMATVPDSIMPELDKIRVINFWSELSAEIGPMKKEAIERLASQAEIPAEVLTGIGNANHWTAWLISDEGIRWIRGYLGLVADALTRGFLRMALASMGVPNPERYAFAFDTSTLAAKPNRLDEALQMHDRFLLSDEEVVKAGAFDPAQMPTVEQRAAQLLLKVVQTQPDLMLDPAIQTALGLPQITSVGLPATADQNTDGNPGGSGNDGPPNDGEAPAAPNPGESDPNGTRALTEALSARLALTAGETSALPSPERVFNAACKLAVYRALELAGGRLTTIQERRGRWAEVPRHELHHWVGPITAEKAHKVTEGAWNHLGVLAADLGVNEHELRALLSGYVTELLCRGVRHHDDLLYAALSIAHQGRGMAVAA
jgi:hypothetical protein